MSFLERIESTLAQSFESLAMPGSPPRLAAAMRHAVFPGGARIRPQLCLAVASACGESVPAISSSAAAAIELLHCASLVHDDLPCFDDADMRRGRPSVHRAFDERLAVLAGDALIVLAFQSLGRIATLAPAQFPAIFSVVARSVGAPRGIVAGQAWECEPAVELASYHAAKTGVLFSAAATAGALSAGASPEPWTRFGDRLGEAYQIADDINDVVAEPSRIGKPVGRDAAFGRPSSARQYGLLPAIERFEQAIAGAIESIPSCRGEGHLRALVQSETERLLPAEVLALHRPAFGEGASAAVMPALSLSLPLQPLASS